MVLTTVSSFATGTGAPAGDRGFIGAGWHATVSKSRGGKDAEDRLYCQPAQRGRGRLLLRGGNTVLEFLLIPLQTSNVRTLL